uniref:RICTOR_V domain-containing protein n=1 Tax=Wuchereria bancrofti TaxID=6293 RepID=A0A1I8EZH9_WUCBA
MGIGDFIEIGFDCCSCLLPLCVYMDVFARWTVECGKQLPMLFVNLIKDTTNVEYVKLIVSCLDYGSEDSFNRFILHTALTIWGIKLLLGQLADPSGKVVRHALRLLHRWIPHYLESVYLIKDICFDVFGDAGILLKTYLFSNESYVKDNSHDVLATLDYWKRKFNMRYAEIVDEDVRVALLDSKRSINGQYARSSNERVAKLGVPMPVHLYGQLVQHDTGRELLLRSNEVDRLLDVLRDSPLPTDTYQTSKLKGALYALGHIVANLNPSLLPMETVPVICRFAECCPVLSIRGSAFWVLNLIGNTQLGSVLLLSLGWESSNFITSEKKSNMLLLKANIDINKIWIRCIDEKLPSQQEINLKTFGVNLENPIFITNKNGTVSLWSALAPKNELLN